MNYHMFRNTGIEQHNVLQLLMLSRFAISGLRKIHTAFLGRVDSAKLSPSLRSGVTARTDLRFLISLPL